VKDLLEKQLAGLVAQHSDWLDAEAWDDACAVVGAAYFDQPDDLATFRKALQERMRDA